MTNLKITPLSDHFIADVAGVDLADVSHDAFAALYDAWLRYGVLRVRGQSMTDD